MFSRCKCDAIFTDTDVMIGDDMCEECRKSHRELTSENNIEEQIDKLQKIFKPKQLKKRI